MRKVIQLVALGGNEHTETDILYALCNDGSIWFKSDPTGAGWENIESVPQFSLIGEEEDEE